MLRRVGEGSQHHDDPSAAPATGLGRRRALGRKGRHAVGALGVVSKAQLSASCPQEVRKPPRTAIDDRSGPTPRLCRSGG